MVLGNSGNVMFLYANLFNYWKLHVDKLSHNHSIYWQNFGEDMSFFTFSASFIETYMSLSRLIKVSLLWKTPWDEMLHVAFCTRILSNQTKGSTHTVSDSLNIDNILKSKTECKQNCICIRKLHRMFTTSCVIVNTVWF